MRIDSNETDESQTPEHKKIVETARERFKLAEEAESENRRLAEDDLKFSAGDQWDAKIKNERDQDGRPCLVINRMPQFIRQITNDQRKNRPAIRVSPVDDFADVDTAKILQGLIRHIEYNSSADLAYDTAFDGAVRKGIGYFRVITDYSDPKSFQQEILIKRVRNSFSVYVDPHSKEPDGSDIEWAFVFEEMSKSTFKELYPDAKLSLMEDWSSVGDDAPGWATKDSCRIAEYFFKEWKTVKLYQLSDGSVLGEDEMPEVLPEGFSVVNERSTRDYDIKWVKTNGVDVLEETIWPGRWIPVIPVIGEELDIDGKVILEGVIRHAKDSQKMLNYWTSTEAETIALAPRAPYIVAEGQIPKEYEGQWKTANKKSHAFLTYKPTSHSGALVGAPQRNIYEPPIQAVTQARMAAAEDMKATTGIYDASLGNRSNETSGIAIRARNQQAETSNFHFVDNLNRSIRHCGRIVLDLIPKVYDTPQAIRILGEDGQEDVVKINQYFEENGKAKFYNLGAGKYDVSVDTGPSYASKRQEAVSAMIDLTRSYPQVAQLAGDLMVQNMDWPGAKEIAERIRKSLPPGIADDPKGKEPLPPEVQAQMQQMSQVIDQLTKHLNDITEEVKTKKMELESRERIEFAKMEVDLKKKMLEAQSKEEIVGFQQEIAMLQRRLDLLNINQPIDDDLNEAGPMAAPSQMNYEQQPINPTGGQAPGNYMGEYDHGDSY